MELQNKGKGYRGTTTTEILYGKGIKIETSPGGAEILDETVPEGKKWRVYIHLEITETDV